MLLKVSTMSVAKKQEKIIATNKVDNNEQESE